MVYGENSRFFLTFCLFLQIIKMLLEILNFFLFKVHTKLNFLCYSKPLLMLKISTFYLLLVMFTDTQEKHIVVKSIHPSFHSEFKTL